MDYLKTVEDRQAELNNLYSRMDTDKGLYYLEEFILQDENDRAVPNVNNVTLNDPATFGHKVKAVLSSAEMQTVVESNDLTDKQTTYIEDFLEALMLAANARIGRKSDILDAYAFWWEQAILRGRIAGACLLRMEGEKFIPDIRLLDTRFLPYEYGEDGLDWVAYQTTRSKHRILKEYGVEIQGSSAVVTDWWDVDYNRVFIGRNQAREQKNPYGYIPIEIIAVPDGSYLQDEDATEHTGESIYAGVRDLYPELNRLATILNTLTEMSFHAGLQYMSEAGERANKPELPPYGKRIVIPVEKNGGYMNMPLNDIKNAARLWHAILEQRIERATLPAIDYGNVNFPLSAVAIGKLTENREPIYTPRIQGMAIFKQRMSEMAIRQIVSKKMQVKLGKEESETKWDWRQLKGPYDIKFRFFPSSKEQDIANLSVAAASEPFLSHDTIRRDVLKLRDPDGESAKKQAEDAERAMPALRLYRYAGSLIDQEQYQAARLAAQQMVMMIDQIGQPQPAATTPESIEPPKANPQAMLPLLAAAGRGGAGPKQTTEKTSEEGNE